MSTGYEVGVLYKGTSAPPTAGQGDVWVNQTTGAMQVHNGLRFAAPTSLIDLDTPQTLTNKILTSPVLSSPVVGSGNVDFGTTSQRLRGDLSSLTLAQRLSVQSSTTDSLTGLGLLPNGSSTTSQLNLHNAADPDNSGYGRLTMQSTGLRLLTTHAGTGSDLPITVEPAAAVSAKFHVSGGVSLLGSTDPGAGVCAVNGRLSTLASATGAAGLTVPHGAAPTSPANGDMWTTTGGLFVRINGVTKTVTLT